MIRFRFLIAAALAFGLAPTAFAQTAGRVTTNAPTYADATTAPFSLTTGGGLRIDLATIAKTAPAVNSGVKDNGTLRVVIATDQPQLTNALKVDGSATTQPVSGTVTVTDGAGALNVIVDSSALPSGASTAAKQPALGTAGTASADVLTVQGIAAMTALKVDGSAVTQPVSGTVTAAQATAANLNATVVGTGTFATQSAITAASGSIASGAIASGAVASGAFASGSISAGAVAAGASSFVKTEDTLSADLDAGVPAMCTRKATPANVSGSDGDYEFLQCSAGRLWTDTQLAAETTKVIGTVRVQGNVGGVLDAVQAAALPANAIALGYKSDGGLAAGTAAIKTPVICEDSAVISTASSGNVELVALTSSETIYVCGWSVVATGAVAVQLIYGTGSACATGETNLTGAMPLAANGGFVQQSPYRIWTAAVSNAVCIELSGAVQVDGYINYTKF